MSYRPTEKTEARKKAQHALLLNSALHIVSEQGFKGLTIQAVAQQAEVAIGTVYKYFESKAVLCTEVFQKGTEKEVNQVQLAAFPVDDEALDKPSNQTCQARLLNAISIFSERAIEGRKLAYALIAEPVDPMVEAERIKYRRSYAEIFDALLREGVECGEFCQQDTRIIATALVGTLAETVLGPYGTSTPESLDFDQALLIKTIQNFCLKAVINSAS